MQYPLDNQISADKFIYFLLSIYTFRKRNVRERQAETNAEIQLDTASSSEKEQRTDLVAYMTTVSEEVQNGADVNTVNEDMYHYIPNESDEYSYAYMDANRRISRCHQIRSGLDTRHPKITMSG